MYIKFVIIVCLAFTFLHGKTQTVQSYIVISDTSYSFYELEKKLTKYSLDYNLKIDMQDKTYDLHKKQICLPENHEDELYAGTYYPRRYSSEYLSIEYIQYYQEDLKKDLMGIIFLITEDKKEAQRKLKNLDINSAYILKAKIYVGCMH